MTNSLTSFFMARHVIFGLTSKMTEEALDACMSSKFTLILTVHRQKNVTTSNDKMKE